MGPGNRALQRGRRTWRRRKLKRGAAEGRLNPSLKNASPRGAKPRSRGALTVEPAIGLAAALAQTTRGNLFPKREGGRAEGEAPGQQTLDVAVGWNRPAEPK